MGLNDALARKEHLGKRGLARKAAGLICTDLKQVLSREQVLSVPRPSEIHVYSFSCLERSCAFNGVLLPVQVFCLTGGVFSP